MARTTCVYYSYPLDPGGDEQSDKDLHSPFRTTLEEEPAEEDPSHRPLQPGETAERRHRPWPYYQC